MDKADKIKIEIDRDIHYRLSLIKVERGLRSISDSIRSVLEGA